YQGDGRFNDYRTRHGDRAGREVNLYSYSIPRWLGQPYSWVFLFGPDRWPYIRYSIDGEETVVGRRALRLRFEPIPPFKKDLNDWFGIAWIDGETGQPLRVEAQTPEDYDRRMKLVSTIAAKPTLQRNELPFHFRVEWITTDFEVEKNGMRFPSQVVLERVDYEVPGHHTEPSFATLLHRVRQTYDNYLF